MARADLEGSEGSKDLYLLEIYSDNNPRPVEVKGKVSFEDQASVESDKVKILIASKKDSTSQVLYAQSPGGEYSAITKLPGEYTIKVEADGYVGETKVFVLPENYSVGEIVFDLNLAAVEAEAIILPHIYFAYNSSRLAAETVEKLGSVIRVLNDNPDLVLEVAGHTDALGSDSYNKRLSEKRAKAVIDHLVKNGINSKRLVSKGYGESKFIALKKNTDGSDAPEGRKFNRRVDFFVVESSNKAIQGEEAEIPEGLKIDK